MNAVTIWAEMLVVPVAIGFVAAMVCYLRDRHDLNKRHKPSH